MNLIFLLTSSAFLLWVIRNVFYWTALWQLKEYRLDRVRIHLLETGQGKNLLFSPLSITKVILIFLYAVPVFLDQFFSAYHGIIAIVYLFQAALVIKENFSQSAKKPIFTPKALFIAIAAFLSILILYAFPLTDPFLWLLFVDKGTTLVIGTIVLFLSFPTEIQRDLKINEAIEKMKRHEKVFVIGVTGSYGKSSTKDYTAQILSRKFNVVKTSGTNNTPIGIAQTILSKINEETEVFVVEMGAYTKGEIASMCQIVHPKMGILTAVNDQHLSLFKTIENTKRAKYELIESLPKDGLALFNGNNQNVFDLYKKTKKQKVLYKTFYHDTPESFPKDGISASSILVKKTSLSFDVHMKGRVLQLEAPLLGAHNIENILPGICIASSLGMSDKQIKAAVSHLTPLPKTMIYYMLSSGVSIIDDTFNANPDAVLAALSYSKVYNKKRMLVMQPMIELGKRAEEEHYRVASEIGVVCDYLFLTNSNFYAAIAKGIADSGGHCMIETGDAKSIAEFLAKNIRKDDVVIFEGKEAAYVLEHMLEKD